ncbi:MAG: hypothetical protein HGA75_06305 [Thiobacillus sp.]|nr:hypothetical protein [Thiobacillus sp.]
MRKRTLRDHRIEPALATRSHPRWLPNRKPLPGLKAMIVDVSLNLCAASAIASFQPCITYAVQGKFLA